MNAAEPFINGARMARALAAQCQDNPSERDRHIKRAERYEHDARMIAEVQPWLNETEQREAAE
jgi:hypothetical protein